MVTPLLCVYWALPGTLGSACDRTLIGVLDTTERTRLERLVHPGDRAAFLVAHAMLRLVLSGHVDLAPGAWQFSLAPSGKPELAASLQPCGLAFSISHTRSIVACVVSRTGQVGIDVEEIASGPPETVLIETCCAGSERALLARTSGALRPLAFAQLWTMKEAVVKALGAGLDLPLQRVECTLDPPRLLSLGGSESAAAAWQISSMMPTRQHVMTLVRSATGAQCSPFALRRLTVESIADQLGFETRNVPTPMT